MDSIIVMITPTIFILVTIIIISINIITIIIMMCIISSSISIIMIRRGNEKQTVSYRPRTANRYLTPIIQAMK